VGIKYRLPAYTEISHMEMGNPMNSSTDLDLIVVVKFIGGQPNSLLSMVPEELFLLISPSIKESYESLVALALRLRYGLRTV
jgi:hypothetical protein